MVFFELNKVCCLPTFFFLWEIHICILIRTVKSIKQNICSWWHRSNVCSTKCRFPQLWFPQKPNIHLDCVCVSLPQLSQEAGSVLYIPVAGHISFFFFFSVLLVFECCSSARKNMRIWLTGWFKFCSESTWSRRFIQLWESCLMHRLETENWLENAMKFRTVLLPTLLYCISIFNCWSFVLLFTWILEISKSILT